MMDAPNSKSGGANESRDWRFPLLGMDVSEKRIGLAMAESDGVSPHPMFTYHRTTRARDLAQCVEWVHAFLVGGVVVGLPLNMDGTPGPRAGWMRRFAHELQQRVDVPVLLQDERLSTVEAEEMLRERGMRREEITERADAVAAALILQRFLTEGPSTER